MNDELFKDEWLQPAIKLLQGDLSREDIENQYSPTDAWEIFDVASCIQLADKE